MRLVMGWVLLVFASVPMLCAQDRKPVIANDVKSAGTNPSKEAQAKTAPADANLVVLTAVVRDKKGVLVQGLTKDNFALLVGNKPQTIRYFEHDNDVPLTLGLLVDVGRNQRDKIEGERAASQAFLQTVLVPASGLRSADKVFVVQFAKQIELLQDATEPKPQIEKALQELGTESTTFHTADEPDTQDSEGRKTRHGGTSLYDSLFLSTDEVTAKQKGRKVLVVLTDGVDVGSKETLTEAIESAQEANTIVYAIYSKEQQRFDQQMGNPNRRTSGGYPGGGYPRGGYPGGGYPGGGYPGGGNPGGGYPGGGGNRNPNGNGGPTGGSRKPGVDGKQVLDRICGETGGRVFEVSKKQTIEAIYTQIAEEIKSEYRLGFAPDEAASRFGLHPIDLNMSDPETNKRMDIQTRSGYYGGDAHSE
jgi:VWFA-related protein